MCFRTLKLAGKYSSCSLISAPIRRRSWPQAGQAFVVQVVLDLDPLQALGQLLPAVLVAVLDAPGDELLAGFFCDARFVERQLLDHLAEQQELPRVELLAARTVVAPQDGGNRRLQPRRRGMPLSA